MSWEHKSLGSILEQSGYHRAGDKELPLLSITMRNGLVDQADKFKKRVASQDTSNYRVAYKNELVVGFPIDEGVLGFQTKYPAGIVSPAYDIWRLKDESSCHIPYLERYLRSPQARRLYASRMRGAVARRRSLTKEDFLKLEIPFPALDDQIRISHLLGKVDWLIAQRKQHLLQLDELLKSVFLEMFGDPVRNEKKWEPLTAKNYSDLVTVGVVVKPASYYSEEGVVALRSLNVRPGRIELGDVVYFSQESNDGPLAKSRLRAGDVVVVRTGKTGTAAVVPDELDGANCIDLIIVRPKIGRTNPHYLVSLLNSERGARLVAAREVGGIQKHFNVGALNSIAFPMPPKELQDEFAGIVAEIDKLKSRYQHSLGELEALYAVLSQQVFKGELDLSRVPLRTDRSMPFSDEDVEQAEKDAQLDKSSKAKDRASVVNDLVEVDEQPQARGELLARWFEHYLADTSPGTSVGSVQFFEAAWQALRASQLEEAGETSELTTADYDALKDLVFEGLDSGTLNQSFDEGKNRVALQKRLTKWGSW
ncbi:restriction endonuclease subunit S [Burkholderia cepacia]|uniref:restriction endonuclease subunit S n=1 Tax=Burkholderia cepacia TaxID=292 RepID=UPI0007C7EAA6|nr:restriction endonuclease subunit S [Burkholderia cepacia]